MGSAPVVRIHSSVFSCPIIAASKLLYRSLHDIYVITHKLLAEVDKLGCRSVRSAYSIFLFRPAFDLETVAVPTLGEKNVEAAHTFVSCNNIEVSPVKDITHMEFATWVRWWSVNAEGRFGAIVPVKMVNTPLFPFILPSSFDGEEVDLFGEGFHVVSSKQIGDSLC